MQEDNYFDDDDLFAIDQLLEQEKSNNSTSLQTSTPTNHHNTVQTNLTYPNQPTQPQGIPIPVPNLQKTKESKQINIGNFFSIPDPKPLEKQEDKPKKIKVTSTKKLETPSTGALRIDEYMQNSKKTSEVIDFSKMSFQDLCEHYKSRETIVGKNSGYEPKLAVDLQNAQIWVYLMSKSFREYQFLMVETSLFYNTLVCLPTGLGKTFIAANVILNYYRWFPEGKIFFLAPTRPLVNQQKAAVECLKSVNDDDIQELTGTISAKKRKDFYQKKRIFFMTPQTIDNDIQNNLIDCEKIVLIIFELLDEAHKALGKYSYSNIIKSIDKSNTGYRIVALSATPGNNEEKVQEVLDNLNIARLETKDENDADVKPYIQSKDVQEIVIYETATIAAIGDIFNEILMKPIKIINNMNIFPADSKLRINKAVEINRTRILQILEEFNNKSDEYTLLIGLGKILFLKELNSVENRALFYEVIGIITSLCNAKRTLHEQGVQSFLECIENFTGNLKNKYGYTLEYKKRLIDSPEFKKLNEYIKEIKRTGEKHPKLNKLYEILSSYFREDENIKKQSRVMIFTNNRASANEICSFLQKDQMIKPSIFVGQGTTKSRSGKNLNEGEEGLDIGEIDLIVCYDSGFCPIRLVQRMGRTGRKRAGKVILLLMQGKEYYSYKNSVKRSEKLKDGLKANSVQKKNSFLKNKTNFRFYSFNPRMLPEDITPRVKFQSDFLEAKPNQDSMKKADNIIPEENLISMASDLLNGDSKGFSNSFGEFEDDDFDYDEICAIIDSQAEKDKELLVPKDGNWPLYQLSENSNNSTDKMQSFNETQDRVAENTCQNKMVKKKDLKRKAEDNDPFGSIGKSKLKQVRLYVEEQECTVKSTSEKNQLSQGES